MDIGRFRDLLRAAREGTAIRRGHKLGRPALSKLTKIGHAEAIHSQTIKNIEDGVIKDPGILTVARIVEALNLSLADFFVALESSHVGALTARKGTHKNSTLSQGFPDGAAVRSDAADTDIERLARALYAAAHERSSEPAPRDLPTRSSGRASGRKRTSRRA